MISGSPYKRVEQRPLLLSSRGRVICITTAQALVQLQAWPYLRDWWDEVMKCGIQQRAEVISNPAAALVSQNQRDFFHESHDAKHRTKTTPPTATTTLTTTACTTTTPTAIADTLGNNLAGVACCTLFLIVTGGGAGGMGGGGRAKFQCRLQH